MLNSMFKRVLLIIFIALYAKSNPWPYKKSDIKKIIDIRCTEYWQVKKAIMHDNSVWLIKQPTQSNGDIEPGLLYEYLYAHVAQITNIYDQKAHIQRSDADSDLFFVRPWIEGQLYKPLDDSQDNSFIQLIQRVPTIQKQFKQGFTRRTLRAIAQKPCMSSVVALDTYLCCLDRSDENIIQQPDDALIPIDGENLISEPLAYYALMTFEKLYEQRYSMSLSERKASKIYQDTLKKLTDSFSSQELNTFFDDLFEYLNTINKTHNNQECYRQIERYKRNFTYNHYFIEQLIDMIDKCLEI